MARTHMPGESNFQTILPEDIEWKPFPAFPPPARLAILVGDPTKAGPYLIRVKVPSGVKLMPHKHPEDRIYTVMSGVFYIGLGEEFDGDKVKVYPPGSVIVLPGRHPTLPLGKIRKVRHASVGDWAAGSGLPRLRGRSAEQALLVKQAHESEQANGAGEGNRTLVISLEGFCSTIELHPRRSRKIAHPARAARAAGTGRIGSRIAQLISSAARQRRPAGTMSALPL